MNSTIRIIHILVCILLLYGCRDQAGENIRPVAKEKIKVKFEEKALWLRGKSLTLPIKTADIIEVLGKPSRKSVYPKSNTILVWDDFGIYAYKPPNKDLITDIDFATGDQDFHFTPNSLFSGSILIAGGEISYSTSSRYLRGLGFIQPFPDTFEYRLEGRYAEVLFNKNATKIIKISLSLSLD